MRAHRSCGVVGVWSTGYTWSSTHDARNGVSRASSLSASGGRHRYSYRSQSGVISLPLSLSAGCRRCAGLLAARADGVCNYETSLSYIPWCVWRPSEGASRVCAPVMRSSSACIDYGISRGYITVTCRSNTWL
jgi:hypothetical protein